MYSRGINREKLIIIVSNIVVRIGINITKAMETLQQDYDDIMMLLEEDLAAC